MPDRNRALHGDIVAVRIRPRACWVVNEELYKSWKQQSSPMVVNRPSDEASGDVHNVLDTVAGSPSNASLGSSPAVNYSCSAEKEVQAYDTPDAMYKCVEEQVVEVIETLTTSVVLEQDQLHEMKVLKKKPQL
ncbi:hypothetical protein ANCCAN_29807 [Ancylostoma caninum]|uniref:Uncharacterized protein n=1 Tax=Ancylostoma caninum TaxID=29170 RepID=A0A368F0M8_ANCCA|nr:hypothetical protein ANCCAN_29807 [Ancylostoma caninum]